MTLKYNNYKGKKAKKAKKNKMAAIQISYFLFLKLLEIDRRCFKKRFQSIARVKK